MSISARYWIGVCLVATVLAPAVASPPDYDDKKWTVSCGLASTRIAQFLARGRIDDVTTGSTSGGERDSLGVDLELLLEGHTDRLVLVGSMLITGGCLPELETVASILYANSHSLEGIRYVRAAYRFLGDPKSATVYPNASKFRADAGLNTYVWQLVEAELAPTYQTEIRAYSLTHVLTEQQRHDAEKKKSRIVAEITRLSRRGNY